MLSILAQRDALRWGVGAYGAAIAIVVVVVVVVVVLATARLLATDRD